MIVRMDGDKYAFEPLLAVQWHGWVALSSGRLTFKLEYVFIAKESRPFQHALQVSAGKGDPPLSPAADRPLSSMGGSPFLPGGSPWQHLLLLKGEPPLPHSKPCGKATRPTPPKDFSSFPTGK
jgi:hypothetical protein